MVSIAPDNLTSFSMSCVSSEIRGGACTGVFGFCVDFFSCLGCDGLELSLPKSPANGFGKFGK
jgi:hypothetical protein